MKDQQSNYYNLGKNLAWIPIVLGIVGGIGRFCHQNSSGVLFLGVGIAAFFFRRYCIKKLSQTAPEEIKELHKTSRRHSIIACWIFGGGFIGFLLRPSFFGEQLPFFNVITRGAFLQGLDQALIPAARTSFNYVLVGAIIGGIIGFVLPKLLKKNDPTNPN